MIHPETEVRFVNPAMGCGVSASADIPRSAIVRVRDGLEAAFAERAVNRLVPAGGPAKTVFADEAGVHRLSRADRVPPNDLRPAPVGHNG